MNSIDAVSRAIRFEGPDWLPLELVDVPGVYNAYGTLDPDSFDAPPGAETFDSAWATYHWTLTPAGQNDQGETLRKDEWGCLQRVPHSPTSAYTIETRPLKDAEDLADYEFPRPETLDPFFARIERVIRERYPDRFICAYVDPGPFLVAFELMDYDGLLLRLATDLPFVRELVRRVMEYQKEQVVRWKRAGAHMINVIDEFAGTQRMMFDPDLWRREFKPMYVDFYRFVKEQGLFAGQLLDGDVSCLFDDLLEMPLDVIEFAQPRVIGLDKIADAFAGQRCVKASVDMMETLATGTPDEVADEARELARLFHSDKGGFIAVALRWHRPEYPAANVAASVQAFNEFRAARLKN